MAEGLDALLATVPGDDDTSPAPDTTTTAQPESTPAPEVKFADLDAVVPDAADIPESFRNKRLADVIRVAEQHKQEAGVAATRNQQWNAMESRARMAEAAVEFMRNQAAQQNQAPPPQMPQETSEDYLQRLAAQPKTVIRGEFDELQQPYVQQLRTTQDELRRTRADMAQNEAREFHNIDRQTWNNTVRPGAAAVMFANNWSLEEPGAWAEATRVYISNAIATAQRFAPSAQPTPPVEVPRPGAPPNGSARSTSRPAATPKLSGRDRENAVDFLDAFNIKPGTPAFAKFEQFAASRPKGE